MNRRRVRNGLWLLVLLSVLSIGYIAATPAFFADDVTELYVLNESGVAADYPTNLSVGDRGTVVVGVVNDRVHTRNYTVVVVLGDQTVDQYTLILGPGAADERSVSFTPRTVGQQSFQVHLYSGTSTEGNPGWRVRFHVEVHDSGVQ